ncbi:hypothetical protein K466DRAFT_484250 [Polyporus arcularius HHB13444]|uniref:Fe2OG dioxygenase domain-containing protein n=1 Tax=Polyporus arcularius HHB13444 TaxID=1314778 RepID=A0A5C3PXA2_9APHY|nr:hypothetical protein K466DRAFT_484250 [Polyporus arcularius HHB13444]
MSDCAPEPPLVKRLRSTLAENPPFCSGTLGLHARDFTLLYGKPEDDIAHRINLSGTSAKDVEAVNKLEQACEAATFGRNAEAVLDETYRKAGKMDSDNFFLGFDVDRSRILDVVRAGLLAGGDETKPIRAELYKLNVYGKDAFFKPHKDTPRGTDMFGSLVLVFPTPHEGGALVLRHEGNEWSFDAAQILSATAHYELKRVAYIAFFSDIEHEVLPVTSGHRVTITYNLYWAPPPAVAFPEELSVIYPKHSNFAAVGEALAELLADPTFLPEGGTLGFGLRHAYPFEKRWERKMPNPLDKLRGWLKGSDAALFRALQALSLDPQPWLLCQSDSYCITVMVDHMVRLGYCEEDECYALLNHHGGVRVVEKNSDGTVKPSKGDEDYEAYGPENGKEVGVFWVTEYGKNNTIGSEYTAYGNEPTTAYMYMVVSLLVDIGPAGDRANTQGIAGSKAMQSTKE